MSAEVSEIWPPVDIGRDSSSAAAAAASSDNSFSQSFLRNSSNRTFGAERIVDGSAECQTMAELCGRAVPGRPGAHWSAKADWSVCRPMRRTFGGVGVAVQNNPQTN